MCTIHNLFVLLKVVHVNFGGHHLSRKAGQRDRLRWEGAACSVGAMVKGDCQTKNTGDYASDNEDEKEVVALDEDDIALLKT